MLERQFTVYRRITTPMTAEQALDAVEQSLRTTVGGSIQRYGNSVEVANGTTNLSLGFVGDFTASVTVTEPTKGTIDLNGTINLQPNTLFWVCAIGGLCLWPAWVVNILYFVVDPRNNYQSALDRVEYASPGAQ